MKKRFVLVPFASMLLSSCINDFFWQKIPDWDADKTFVSKAIPLVNLASDDYDIKGEELNIWFVDGSDVPYVDIRNFFNAFEGFFDTENISYNFVLTQGYVELRYQKTFTVIMDWDENQIYSGSYDDFPWYSYQGASTNYSEHLYATNDYYDRDAIFFLDAGKYDFDILYKDKKCIVPLFLMNTLFCSTSGFNVFYNGEKCFATAGEMRS